MAHERLRIRTVTICVLALCFILSSGLAAFAQEKPCAGDIEKFCQGVQPGGGRITKCLAQHKDELTPGCKARVEEVVLQLKGMQQACEDDIMTFCPDVKPGGHRIVKCLRLHESELSSECKGKIAEVRKGLKK